MLRHRSVWKITLAVASISSLILATAWLPPLILRQNETEAATSTASTLLHPKTVVPQPLQDSPSSSTSEVPVRLRGNLTLAHLPSLPHCVNYQMRGVEGLFSSWEQVWEQLAPPAYSHANTGHNNNIQLRMGIVTVENPDNFVSLAKGNFHLFHFLEFAVMAFAEWTQLSSHVAAMGRRDSPVVVSWWYSPLLTRREICGVAGGMNCFILHKLWPTLPAVHGLESNSHVVQSWHEAYRGDLPRKRPTSMADMAHPPTDDGADHRMDAMMEEVDVVLLMDRVQCKREQTTRIHKIWTHYLDSFPAQEWYNTMVQGVQQRQQQGTRSQEGEEASDASPLDARPSQPRPPQKLVVGYIDRQQTNRRLPDKFHMWLVAYLRRHPAVEFVHLRMERYAAAAQIQLAQGLDMMVGVHGNGLSHEFWMKPASYVLEMYWDFSFQYDYASAAQLMNHTYRGLHNGQILDAARIAARDPKMLVCCPTKVRWIEAHWNMTASQEAVESFVEQALREKGISTVSPRHAL
eukprot:scaffold5944_cov101-Amphora_coffeaeformis.AAC.5